MALAFAVAPYRLLFKHPFGTSHGVRDGTDSIFIRLSADGQHGYGEVTLPPYLKEKPATVLERLRTIAGRPWASPTELIAALDRLEPLLNGANGCRAGLHMAAVDLLGKQKQLPVHQLLGVDKRKLPITLVTIGAAQPEAIPVKLKELPPSGALKVKVTGATEALSIKTIIGLDNRRIFLDGNQGVPTLEEAFVLGNAAGDRLLGFEEPFGTDQRELNRELAEGTGVVVYADEAVQQAADIEAAAGQYGGINIKLMKCGGLDRAMECTRAAARHELRVMLGSMSESSLGCTAMAQLAGQADLVDLDGPWLLRNDPFTGIDLVRGSLKVPKGPGFGCELRGELAFTPIGA